MKAVNPYLNFLGTSEQAFQFYRSVFGGESAVLQRFGMQWMLNFTYPQIGVKQPTG